MTSPITSARSPLNCRTRSIALPIDTSSTTRESREALYHLTQDRHGRTSRVSSGRDIHGVFAAQSGNARYECSMCRVVVPARQAAASSPRSVGAANQLRTLRRSYVLILIGVVHDVH